MNIPAISGEGGSTMYLKQSNVFAGLEHTFLKLNIDNPGCPTGAMGASIVPTDKRKDFQNGIR
jgi:hypothetical protein